MQSDLEVLARAPGRKMGPFCQEGPQEFHLDTSGLKCLLSVFPLKTESSLGQAPPLGSQSRYDASSQPDHGSLPVMVADLSPSGY